MSRGGYREGAGRPRGSSNKCSIQQSQRLSELARAHTDEALLTLVDVARNGRTDAARVSAANALLDRAYGKPAIDEGKEIVDLPPLVVQRAESSWRDFTAAWKDFWEATFESHYVWLS